MLQGPAVPSMHRLPRAPRPDHWPVGRPDQEGSRDPGHGHVRGHRGVLRRWAARRSDRGGSGLRHRDESHRRLRVRRSPPGRVHRRRRRRQSGVAVDESARGDREHRGLHGGSRLPTPGPSSLQALGPLGRVRRQPSPGRPARGPAGGTVPGRRGERRDGRDRDRRRGRGRTVAPGSHVLGQRQRLPRAGSAGRTSSSQVLLSGPGVGRYRGG
mmetsp:Transcript_43429/g.80814  ORF Transcript_43429/g.80814 Transcript_43429/m.80814 type:complete len:213 (-) Transcript_43429:489-1127(-)